MAKFLVSIVALHIAILFSHNGMIGIEEEDEELLTSKEIAIL